MTVPTSAFGRSMTDPRNRSHIEDMIDLLCELDEQYTTAAQQGTLTPTMKKFMVEQIDALESTLWDLDLNRGDLEWFSLRPINGINRIGDPWYVEHLSPL